ncbi:hypothetical protein DRB87_10920 [Pandoraea sp. XY-2]|nr:hypothetical protein DRB87_10920 [Pandoraea sp. XY-2]
MKRALSIASSAVLILAAIPALAQPKDDDWGCDRGYGPGMMGGGYGYGPGMMGGGYGYGPGMMGGGYGYGPGMMAGPGWGPGPGGWGGPGGSVKTSS